MNNTDSKKIIGIDLGTSFSCVAVWESGNITVIANTEGRKVTPSCVAITPNGIKIGEPARRQAAIFPQMTISSVKRLMGENYASIEHLLPQFSYKVVKGANGRAAIELGDRQYLPFQISAYILGYLKECAESYLGGKVSKAVITVPAYFDDSQRQATKVAAGLAGLEVMQILNEPTAAALAFGKAGLKLGRLLVFDLGGGTFDISMLNCYENIYDVFGNGGDTHLGGDDIDSALYDFLLEDFLSRCEPGYQLLPDQRIRLREAVEDAKIQLSSSMTADVTLTWLAPDSKKCPHLVKTVTRRMLEELAAPIVNRCREKCRETVERAEIDLSQIDHVLMVGGSSNIPCIRKMVEEFFGKSPSYIQEAEQCVAIGAAIEAARINRELDSVHLLDVTPLSLGIITSGLNYDEIIEPNTSVPTSRTIRYEAMNASQKGVSIIVVQAKSEGGRLHRKRIGDFDLMGIMAGRNGVAEVAVTFDIDRNGLLTVSARDVASGSNEQRRIENASVLSEDELSEIREEMGLDDGAGLSLMEIVRKSRQEPESMDGSVIHH